MLKKFDLLMGFFFGGVRARRQATHVSLARDRVAALRLGMRVLVGRSGTGAVVVTNLACLHE